MSYVDAESGRALPDRRQAPRGPSRTGATSASRWTACSTTWAASSRAWATRRWERCGRCTTARTCSNEIDPAFSEHIRAHVRRAELADPFHVSANTDPKGDRARRPQDQDPDVLLHVAGETSNGIVVRGAKFETAAAYANQAFVKPTIGDWGDAELSDYAVGFVVDMGAPGIRHICRSTFGGRDAVDYPMSTRFDEIDTMIVFDDVEIPWENVLFYRHTRGGGVHPRHPAPLQHVPVRAAASALRRPAASAWRTPTPLQTGIKMHQAVREKLAELVCYREGINAHLTAAIEMAEVSPGGLLMPNQALLYTGRVLACTQLPAMMHLARDLCGGQLCVLPSAATFADPEAGPWLEKYLAVGEVAGRGSPAAVRVRARPAQLRLRRPPADLPAVRPVARVRAPARGLQQLRLRRAGRPRAPLRRAASSRWRRRRPADERPERGAGGVCGVGASIAARHGAGLEQGELDLIVDGAVAIRDGLIAAVGPTDEVLREWGDPSVPSLDATGLTVLPGLIECHSHPLFAGERHAEYAKRLAGASLAEIAAAGRRDLGQCAGDA